jgi:uncharacterized protein (TIGR00369 family)
MNAKNFLQLFFQAIQSANIIHAVQSKENLSGEIISADQNSLKSLLADLSLNQIDVSKWAIAYPVNNPFLAHLGVHLLKADQQGALLHLPLANHLTNSWGKAHGGVLMTVMDMAMSWSARAQHLDHLGAATIEMKTTFMKAVEGDLWVVGSLVHKTSTLAFCQAHVYNHLGELCCQSTSTFKYSKRLIEVTNT